MNRDLKKCLFGLGLLAIMVAALVFFRDHLAFIGEGWHHLLDARPGPVIVAIALAVLAFYAMAQVMYLLLSRGGAHITLTSATALTFASNAWSTSLPGGPAFAAFLTFKVQRRWGASVALASWFIVLSSAISTMWLLFLGILSVVYLGADFNLWSVMGTLILMTGITSLLWWFSRHPDPLLRVFSRWPSIAQHITQLNEVQLPIRTFGLATLCSLANWLLEAGVLWISVWAVTDQLQPLAPVLLAFVTSKFVGTAQVTPGGLGPVEAVLIATLVATGYDAASATGAVLIYRLITLILMTALGWAIYLLYFVRRGISARTDDAGNLEKNQKDA